MEDPRKNSFVRQKACRHLYKENLNISLSYIFFNNDSCFETNLQHNYCEKNDELHYATAPEMRMTSVIRLYSKMTLISPYLIWIVKER